MALTGVPPSPSGPLCAERESKRDANFEVSEPCSSNSSNAKLPSPSTAVGETRSTMQSNTLPFPKDDYLSASLNYPHFDGYDAFASTDDPDCGRQTAYFRGRPSPPYSRTSSHDNMAASNVTGNEGLDGIHNPNHYYQTTAVGTARELPSAYDTVGHQYQQPRDYFDRNVYPLSNTPLGTPGFAQAAPSGDDRMQSFDISYLAQSPTLPVPDRQPTWDSRWKSLFDPSKAQGLPSPSPTVSQYQQSCRSDSAAFLAPEYDTARRQSSDTTSISTKSAKSGYNPVSTVLAHHVYSVLKGEQAWNVIKQLQREDIVRDVWSEIATIAHPDKAPQAGESRLWEQIVGGEIPLDLYRLGGEDLVLLFAGLSVLARGAARKQQNDPSTQRADADPLKVFIDAHAE